MQFWSVAEIYDQATADSSPRIQYGGSVNAGNAAELLPPDIDGGLACVTQGHDFGKIVTMQVITKL